MTDDEPILPEPILSVEIAPDAVKYDTETAWTFDEGGYSIRDQRGVTIAKVVPHACSHERAVMNGNLAAAAPTLRRLLVASLDVLSVASSPLYDEAFEFLKTLNE